MEFDKSRVYTALNADELKQGDKVIVAGNIGTLKWALNYEKIESLYNEIVEIKDENHPVRFVVKAVGHDSKTTDYALAYLVERAENCTNCGGRITCIRQKPEHPELTKCCNYKHYECSEYKPKTEQKCEDCTIDEICVEGKKIYKDVPCPYHRAKPHYRPFKDTDELIKVWDAKIGTPKWGTDGDLTMPHIWVREKGCNKSADLITCYGSKGITVRGKGMYFDTLFTMFEFLDGSPCGVEE